MAARIGIRVEGLRKKLGPNQALDGVGMDFQPAVLHGLIGPEGAGKTTLLRHLMGLLKANEGSVRYSDHGEEVRLEQIRGHMAYMPQQQSLYPDLSIGEHLEFFKDLYQIPEEVFEKRRTELLKITRLDQFVQRSARQLSGGMYKKLGLMCALLQSPSVLLLDEPTNGVDPISRREFWDLLYRLAASEILIIVATAYMDEAERCGQVHLIASGKLVAEGEPRAILKREGVKGFDELFIRRAEEAAR